jgi:hypothetical protein
MRRLATTRPGHDQLIDAPDADDARVTVVKLPGGPALAAKRLGQPMRLVGRFDQSAFLLQAPELRVSPAVALEHLDESVDVDEPAVCGLLVTAARGGVEGAGACERRHADGVSARTGEQAVRHVGVHLQDKLIDLLPREVVGWQQRVGDQQRGVKRWLRRGGPTDVVAVGLEKLTLQTICLHRIDRPRPQLFDLLQHLLSAGILERGEIAHQHRDLDDLPGVGIPHPLRRAVGIEAHAPLFAGVVEGLLVRVGREPVAAPEFLHQLPGVVAGAFATKRLGQHQPGSVLLGERVHRLGVDLTSGKP